MPGRGKGLVAQPRRVVVLMPVLLLAMSVAALVAALLPQPAQATSDWWVEVTADTVNLRSEPGAWAEVVGQAWGGEWVSVLDGPTADGWYWVDTGDRSGWADGSLLGFGAGGGTASSTAAWGERWVDVNRSSQTVTLFEGETSIASYWGAMGSDGSADGFFATAVGTHYVYEKTEALSWTDYGGGWIRDWVGFDPNRLNGFHSFLMDENGWQVPGGDGPTGGCVALEPTIAEQVFWFVSIGTRVEVHW